MTNPTTSPDGTCPATGELVILLANGSQIRSGWCDKDDPDALPAGDYISVLDAQGQQVFYADSADLLADPVKGRRLLNDMLQACHRQAVTS